MSFENLSRENAENMSNNTNDHSMKHDRHLHCRKRRLKSSVVRDPNGSISTFRHFYQSGGRDYEQYRRWLQTISNPSAVAFNKGKNEPIQNESSADGVLPYQSAPRIISTQTSIKPMRYLPLPVEVSPLIKALFDSQLRLLRDRSPPLFAPPMNHWSVTDVGRFIEKHFPEKNIARKFIEQKIDGRTLPLLTEDHLTGIFKMKLGPALHLLALVLSIPK